MHFAWRSYIWGANLCTFSYCIPIAGGPFVYIFYDNPIGVGGNLCTFSNGIPKAGGSLYTFLYGIHIAGGAICIRF